MSEEKDKPRYMSDLGFREKVKSIGKLKGQCRDIEKEIKTLQATITEKQGYISEDENRILEAMIDRRLTKVVVGNVLITLDDSRDEDAPRIIFESIHFVAFEPIPGVLGS